MTVSVQEISLTVPEIADFWAEVTELSATLETLAHTDWDRVTQFKGWTINDVILHLYASDYTALAAARSAEDFSALRRDMLQVRNTGLSMIEESRLRFPDLRAAALRTSWHAQAAALCDTLALKDPKDKLPWSGPAMSVRTFAVARQMETWAHGQEILDILGCSRVARDRIKNIAVLGIKTFAWSFSNRGLPVPEHPPHVRLEAPSGGIWDWNAASMGGLVTGRAEEFCQVVTQVRNFRDTQLSATGDTAQAWVSIAQCFAGPPADPPAPGTRYRVAAEMNSQTGTVSQDTFQEKKENA